MAKVGNVLVVSMTTLFLAWRKEGRVGTARPFFSGPLGSLHAYTPDESEATSFLSDGLRKRVFCESNESYHDYSMTSIRMRAASGGPVVETYASLRAAHAVTCYGEPISRPPGVPLSGRPLR